MPEKVTMAVGDRHKQPITLYKDAVTYAIDSSSTIQAYVVTPKTVDARETLAGPVTVLESESGSDWVNSLIVAVFDAASWKDTEYEGWAQFKVEVDDPVQDEILTTYGPADIFVRQG